MPVDQDVRPSPATAMRRSALRGMSFAQIESGLAGLVMVSSLMISSLLVPMAVDDVAGSKHAGVRIVALTAEHPDRIRVGYLIALIALLCVGPATSHLQRLAPDRGHMLTDLGLRFIRIGSLFGAIGNAFA